MTVTPGVSGVTPSRDAAGLSSMDDAAPESSNALILVPLTATSSTICG